jgi:hypothetical protein
MEKVERVEPRGLQHEGPAHKKIEFHKIINNIQCRLAVNRVILNSFIVTRTRFSKLNWILSRRYLKIIIFYL